MLLRSSQCIYQMNRPYFDLGPSTGGPLHVCGVEFSYRHIDDGRIDSQGLQVILPASFRESLMRQTNRPAFNLDQPVQLPNELRTQRWHDLCQRLACYDGLNPIGQLRIANLLASLGLHRAVVALPKSPQDIARDPISAALALRVATSQMSIDMEYGSYDRTEFERIAENAPAGAPAKLAAALQIVVQDTKLGKGLPSLVSAVTVASEALENIDSSLGDFTIGLLTSMYYRATAFVNTLTGDKTRLVQMMDECQSWAENLQPTNLEQRVVALENRAIIAQSRSKEAMWLGDLNLAEERASQSVTFDPEDSIYRLEHGYRLIELDRVDEAAGEFDRAAELGPLRTEEALFMAGQIREHLGDLERANEDYLELHNLAQQMGDPGLMEWSQLRRVEIQKAKSPSTLSKTTFPLGIR